QNFSIFIFVDRQRLGWTVEVAFGIRRAHFDLALFVQITLRNSDRTDGFENQIIFVLHFVWNEPVRNTAGDHNVIFSPISLLTENGLERAASFEYKDDLVGAAVAIILKFIVSLFGARTIRNYVLVEQNRNASGIDIPSARNVGRFQMMVSERTLSGFLEFLVF